jgi:cleavage and polyadenylation specificity factor subunit 3
MEIPADGITVQVVGKLAKKVPHFPDGESSSVVTKDQIISGVLVQQDFKYSLMAPEDLREYAGLTTTVVTCKQRIPMYAAGHDLVRWSLESMFGAVVNLEDDWAEEDELAAKKEEVEDDDEYDPEKDLANELDDEEVYGDKGKFSGKTFRIMDTVTIRCHKTYVELEWIGNILNDGIADSVAAILLNLESSPAAVKCESSLAHRSASCKTDPPRRRIQGSSRPSPRSWTWQYFYRSHPLSARPHGSRTAHPAPFDVPGGAIRRLRRAPGAPQAVRRRDGG